MEKQSDYDRLWNWSIWILCQLREVRVKQAKFREKDTKLIMEQL